VQAPLEWGPTGQRLEQQRAKGSRFFIGNQLSALDIYWAAFAALIQPLPHEQCPMPAAFRKSYTNTDPVIQAAAHPLLFEHRDFHVGSHSRNGLHKLRPKVRAFVNSCVRLDGTPMRPVAVG
jgi:hypothetical protein